MSPLRSVLSAKWLCIRTPMHPAWRRFARSSRLARRAPRRPQCDKPFRGQHTSPCASGADFSILRYGQVWEDADVLLDALDVQPGDVCLSIASAGDNALALLTRHPAHVLAVDLSPAQIASLELRVAAYRELSHAELLELIGSRPSRRRGALYARCRPALSAAARTFWDGRSADIEHGIGSAGRFERYLGIFRRYVLPLAHGRRSVEALIQRRSPQERQEFYHRHWNTWRWRLIFRAFFSRGVMGRVGRDPEFFRYVDGQVAACVLERTRRALIELDPAENPYVHWILTGTHGEVLPCALRPEHFETIRANVDRLAWRCEPVEHALERADAQSFDCFNLSDLFEYVSPAHYERTLVSIVRASRPGARIAYWNLFATRRRPESLAARIRPLDHLAARLHDRDRAFFYGALRVEEVS